MNERSSKMILFFFLGNTVIYLIFPTKYFHHIQCILKSHEQSSSPLSNLQYLESQESLKILQTINIGTVFLDNMMNLDSANQGFPNRVVKRKLARVYVFRYQNRVNSFFSKIEKLTKLIRLKIGKIG